MVIYSYVLKEAAEREPPKATLLVSVKSKFGDWKDCDNNDAWMVPFVEEFGTVPSTFLIADTLLELDILYDRLLLRPMGARTCKAEVALWEAKKLKRLLGHSKKLHRASELSNHPGLQRVKDAWTAHAAPRVSKDNGAIADNLLLPAEQNALAEARR